MNLNKDAYERLLYWIRERYNIYLKRLRGEPKPWTDDPILRDCFFTMPYREYDKTTKWVRHFIRDPNYDDPRVILALIIFRWFNYIPTGDILLGSPQPVNLPRDSGPTGGYSSNLFLNWDPDEAKRRLAPNILGKPHTKEGYGTKTFSGSTIVPPPQRSRGTRSPIARPKAFAPPTIGPRYAPPTQIFTGAFNISNSGSTKSKIDRVIDDYIQPMWEERKNIMEWFRTNCDSLEAAHKMLSSFMGMGGSGFMSYEVICDLRFTGMLEDAEDTETWTSMGPGASRGLHRLLGTFPKSVIGWKPRPPTGWQRYMRDLLQKINSDLHTSSKNAFEIDDPLSARLESELVGDSPVGNRTPLLPRFEMREVEHSLCEFDKYERVRTGEGKSKRNYSGAK